MNDKYQEAIKIASEYHKWQFRKDGTPYISHPLRVAELLKDNWFPEDALISAVLHDIYEDTDINNLQINELFWTRVWFIVNALSKNQKPKNNEKLKKEYSKKQEKKKVSNLEKYNTFEEYIDYRFHLYLNRLYNWIIAEPWVFFIKVSDQLDNLSDMTAFRNDKKLRKIEEVEKYFLPLYYKCENIFSLDIKNLELYKKFIKMLEEKIKETKNNI